MSYPVGWDLVNITGTYIARDGTPCTGSVTLSSPQLVLRAGTIVPAADIVFDLVNGTFSGQIPATDDPNASPVGWTYTVTENVPGGRQGYQIVAPHTSPGIDLSTVVPVTMPQPPTYGFPYVTLAQLAGTAVGDGAYLIGYQNPASGSVAETVQSRLDLLVFDIEEFGGGTAVADNGPPLAAALAALPSSGGLVRFGRGAYTFLTAVSGTLASGAGAFGLVGEGPGATILTFPNGTGITLTLQSERSTVHVHQLGFTTSTNNTATCLTVNQTSPLGQFETSTFRDLTFRGTVDSSTCWATAAIINQLSGTSWDNVTIHGGGTTGTGIDFKGNTSLSNASIYHNLAKCIFNEMGYGVVYDQWAQGITVTQSNFQNGNVGIYGPPASLGDGQAQLNVDNCQFAVEQTAILVENGCSLISINGNCIIVNTASNSNGISLTNCNFIEVNGNNIVQSTGSANPTYGLVITGTSSVGSVVGNNFSELQNGIYLNGTASNIRCVRNKYHSVTNNVVNSSTGTGNEFWGDAATNTANLTPGASPWTYTAGTSPEVHYINGGTVSLVTKYGVFLARSTNCQIQLKPGESYVLTYSVAPTIGYEKW